MTGGPFIFELKSPATAKAWSRIVSAGRRNRGPRAKSRFSGSSTDWATSAGDDRYRRGLYTTWRRSNPYPSMSAFDAP
ncbi:MAG: DUF1553 domain-containing protein, partial [Pirellula sp.]